TTSWRTGATLDDTLDARPDALDGAAIHFALASVARLRLTKVAGDATPFSNDDSVPNFIARVTTESGEPVGHVQLFWFPQENLSQFNVYTDMHGAARAVMRPCLVTSLAVNIVAPSTERVSFFPATIRGRPQVVDIVNATSYRPAILHPGDTL